LILNFDKKKKNTVTTSTFSVARTFLGRLLFFELSFYCA